MFIGREEELALLNKKYQSGNFEFGVIYGTRRIGKTTLINEFIKDKDAIYFQAKEVAVKDNRRAFSRAINEKMSLPLDYVYPDWETIFAAILSFYKGKRGILVIDEYPYLAARGSGFSSYLQDFIDNHAKESQLMILLSGSNISFMEKEMKNRTSPLYKRKTFAMKIAPLAFKDAVAFLKGISLEGKASYLSLFGSHPYYLSFIDKRASFEDNLQELVYSKEGPLLDAPNDVLTSSVRESAFYNSILSAISKGYITIDAIAEYLEETAPKIGKYLDRLLKDAIVEKKVMFNSTRKTYYAIRDRFLDFWYRFIMDEESRIAIGFGKAVYQEQTNGIKNFLEHHYEDVCLDYLQEESLSGHLGAPYYPIQNLRIEKSELGRSIEIDGLSRYQSHLLVVECKFTNRKRTYQDCLDMQEDVSIRLFAKQTDKEFYLFSKNGFADGLKEKLGENFHLVKNKDFLN